MRDEVVKGVRRTVRALTREYGIADRRERPLLPEPTFVPEQLPLTEFLQAPGEKGVDRQARSSSPNAAIRSAEG